MISHTGEMASGKRKSGSRESKSQEPGADGRLPSGFPGYLDRPALEVLEQLVMLGGVEAVGAQKRSRVLENVLDSLSTVAQMEIEPEFHPDVVLSASLMTAVGRLWELGWQPLDVPHVLRRLQTARAASLVVASILAQAAVEPAFEKAPDEWTQQLRALGFGVTESEDPGQGSFDDLMPAITEGSASVVTTWALGEGLRPVDAWREVLRVVGELHKLPPLTRLVEPPSRWGMAPPRVRHAHDLKMLTRIRALLAKAESTNYPAEAETFSAKAQELMTRHEIDAAVLDLARAGERAGLGIDDPDIRPQRIHIDDPYGPEKAQLLATVAAANEVRAVWDETHGFVVVVGRELNLELVELLFTSLLVQATRAMTAAGEFAGDRRSPGFRRAFLLSYASRIGERLAEVERLALAAAGRQWGTELVPVMADRAAAVDGAFERLFPNTRSRGTRMVDANGWWAGREAADQAVIKGN